MAARIVERVLSVAVVAGIALEADPVFATQVLEEIIVTARKREESIMTVPVVTTVLGREQLEQFALDDLGRVADQVPGLVLGESSLSFGYQVSMRGVGTSVLSATIDQSVSFNVDGLQLTQGLAYQSAMFDMAQVEVLKGPQGLFFGKASPGGVIAIKTADPTDEIEIIVRGGYEFEAEEQLGELIISGPLTDTLGARLAGSFSDADGYFDNNAYAAPGTGAVDPGVDSAVKNETTTLRGTLLWTPTERFRSKLKVNYSDAENDGYGGEPQLYSCPDGRATTLPPATYSYDFLGGAEDCRFDDKFPRVFMDPAVFPAVKNNGVPYMKAEQAYGTLDLDYDLTESLALNSVTGYYDIDQEVMINSTSTTYAAPIIATQTGFQRDDFTQELRLTSDFTDSAVNFMVGAFYQDASMGFRVDVPVNMTYVPAPTGRLGFAQHEVGIEAWSLFGQVLWDISPELELGVGARWTDEERDFTQKNLISGTPVVTPTANPEITSSDLSPEISLTWMPTDDLTVFGALKEAYKSGSYGSTGVFNPGQDNSFGDEKVVGGEAGVKARLLDGALMTNVAAYYYSYDDMQVGANAFDANGFLVISTLNAASAEVYGVEADASYAVAQVEGLVLHAAANWNQAQFEDFDNAQCWEGQTIADGCDQIYDAKTGQYNAQDLSGEELVRAPDWTGNVGASYERPLGNGMILGLGWTTSFSSDYYAELTHRKDAMQRDYFKHSASISLREHDDGWMVELIGNNLGDEIVTGNCTSANFQDGGPIFKTAPYGKATRGPGGVAEIACAADRGRAVWLRLTLRPAVLAGK